jgi:hypothetical protein
MRVKAIDVREARGQANDGICVFSENESLAEPSLPIAVYHSCLWEGAGCPFKRF